MAQRAKKHVQLLVNHVTVPATVPNVFRENMVKGRGAIRADFGPMPEINFVVITI